MQRYKSKLSGSPLDTARTDSQPDAPTINSKHVWPAKFWSGIGRFHHKRPSGVSAEGKPRFIYQRATFAATLLFLLMFSGPPRLRIRDVDASLRGEFDSVVVLNIVVWGFAGLWVLYQGMKHLLVKRRLPHFWLPQKQGLVMVLCLAVSAVVSKAPALSAFKIYQMGVCLLFTHLFVQRFGYASCLKRIFWGTVLLCAAIAVCAFLAPDLVWVGSDFNPEPTRLRGDLIAPTGVVSVFAIILLLTGVRKIWRVLPLSLLALFFGLLATSLMRTAYLAVLVFFALVLVKRHSLRSLRHFAYLFCALALLLFVYHWVPSLSQYRDPETISSLSDRVGLWRYLSTVTLTRSPWLGLGYYSASRVYGPEYNAGLGTAHSMFFEILSGGGIVACSLFTILCLTLSVYAGCIIYKNRDRLSLAIASLFIASLLFGFMGDEIDSGPVALCFWYSAAALPWLHERSSMHKTRPVVSRRRLPVSAGVQLYSEVS
jgi:hypothetical protein